MHIFDCVFIYPKLVLQLLLWIIFSIKRKHITNLLYLIPLVLFIPPCVSNLSSGMFLFSLKNFSVSYRLCLLATNSFNFFYTWEYFHFNFISEWMFHLIYNSGFSFFCSSTLTVSFCYLLSSTISDKKSIVKHIIVPFYVMSHFLWLLWRVVFYHFDYVVSSYGALFTYPTSDLVSYLHLNVNVFNQLSEVWRYCSKILSPLLFLSSPLPTPFIHVGMLIIVSQVFRVLLLIFSIF